MTKGRTILIQKDPAKGQIRSRNTALFLCTYHVEIADKNNWRKTSSTFLHLEKNGLLANEQKRYRKRSRGTKDSFFYIKHLQLRIQKLQSPARHISITDVGE